MRQLVGSLRVCGGTLFCFDFEGAHSFVYKLLFWSGEMEIGCIEPYFVAYLIVNGRAPFLVILCFHLQGSLFEGLLGSSVDLLHFGDKDGGDRGSERNCGFCSR